MLVDLTKGNIIKTIVKTSLPMVIAFLLESAFNIVDAFYVGKISSEALAAVSISYPVIFLIIALGGGIGVGSTSVVARFIGAKKYKEADNAAEHAMLTAVVLGVVLMIFGLLAAPTLFSFIGAEESLKTLALEYLNIILFFSVFMLLAMVGNSILRAEGDMRTPMKVMAYSAVLNIILDPLFIFTLGLGVKGAAIATVISRAAGMIYLLYHILSGKSWIRLKPKDFKFNFDYIKKIFIVGIPSSLSNVTMSFGMFLVTAIVGLYGTDALAAFGVGFRVDTLAVLPAIGVFTAVISIVGQSVGAGKIKRAREVTWKSGLLAAIPMTLIGALFYIFAPQIIAIFNSNPIVIEHGTSFLRIIPFSYIFLGFSMCFAGAFIGAGKAMNALLVTILRSIVFSVPLAYLLSQVYGVPGIWMGTALGTILGSITGYLLFKYTRWWKN